MRKKWLKQQCKRLLNLRRGSTSRARWPQTSPSALHGQKLTDEEFLLYCAGYLDGEGCWYAYPDGAIKVNASNTFPYTLLNIAERFGGAVRHRGALRPSDRTVFEWAIYGTDARRFSQMLYPYLHEKKEQCLLLIQIHESAPRSARRARLMENLKTLKRIDYTEED